MFVLALESSTEITTVALGKNGEVVAEKQIKSNRYSETIMLLIDNLLRSQNLKISEIGGFAVGTGPGSFTGIRAGIATVKSLAQVLRKPSIGVPSADGIAHSILINKNPADSFSKIVIIMDAKRGQFYVTEYIIEDKSPNGHKTGLVTEDEIGGLIGSFDEKVVIGGTAVPILEGELAEHNIKIADVDNLLPKASQIVGIATDGLQKLEWQNLFTIEPIYWRPSDARTLKERMKKQ